MLRREPCHLPPSLCAVGCGWVCVALGGYDDLVRPFLSDTHCFEFGGVGGMIWAGHVTCHACAVVLAVVAAGAAVVLILKDVVGVLLCLLALLLLLFMGAYIVLKLGA